jgi:hypothetical protein
MSKSKQLNFFLSPEDLVEVKKFLKEEGGVILKRNSEKSTFFDEYNIEKNYENIFQVCICREEDKNKIFHEHIEPTNSYYVDILKSNCIEFSIGGFYPYSDKELHRSRFYFIYEYYKDGDLIKKSPEFIEWANTLIKKFKNRFLIKSPIYSNDFFSEQCINWVTLNNAKLESGGQKFVVYIA